MKRIYKDILIFAGLVLSAYVFCIVTIGQTALDIQLHDTYFVVERPYLATVIIGLLTFFFFLARAITRKFKIMSTNIGLIVGLLITDYIIFIVVRLLNAMNGTMAWTWGVFCLFIIGTVIVSLQTYQLWRGSRKLGR